MAKTIHNIRKQFLRQGDWVNKCQCKQRKNVVFQEDLNKYNEEEAERALNDGSQITCDGWQVTWNTKDTDVPSGHTEYGLFFLTEYDADGVMAQLLMGVLPDAG